MNRFRMTQRRGFSLIEVLIAILILALGLLGLGAVIPVVVKQQRSAADATLGIAAAKAAEAYILSRPEFDPVPSTAPGVPNAWSNWSRNNNWAPTSPPGIAYQWETNLTGLDLTTGDMAIADSSGAARSTVTIKLADRLWPSFSSQTVNTVGEGLDPYRPQFVWDFVGRRVKVNHPGAAVTNAERIQVAIFVRRIDSNIPATRTDNGSGVVTALKLFDVLTGRPPVTTSQRCLPVAVQSTADPIPTNNGKNETGGLTYGAVQKVSAWFDTVQRDHIYLSDGNRTLVDLAARPGQKLVDNLGNIYTVREVIDDTDPTETIVKVTPAVPGFVGDPNATGSAEVDETRFRQVIFTPQIPGTVRIFTITRPK